MRHNTINRITPANRFRSSILAYSKKLSYHQTILLKITTVDCRCGFVPRLSTKVKSLCDAKYALDQALSASKKQ